MPQPTRQLRWATSPRAGPSRVTIKRDHWEIREVASGKGVGLIFGDDDRNARLAAMAPQLRDALVLLRNWCRPGVDWADEIPRGLLRLADEVLAGTPEARDICQDCGREIEGSDCVSTRENLILCMACFAKAGRSLGVVEDEPDVQGKGTP